VRTEHRSNDRRQKNREENAERHNDDPAATKLPAKLA